MSFSTWTPLAVSSEARDWKGSAWRMVEAQHIASTMKLVGTLAEQDLLETLLEDSKPLLPAAAAGLDYLLATPFRYDPLRPGSRFRAVTDPGVFYGAESVRSASAELGYWRWKFLRDAVDLVKLEPVAHTAFRAEMSTLAVDLRHSPFNVAAAAWTHPSDYTSTQAFARVARDANLGGIVYQSVRDPQPAWCIALLTPQAFAKPKPSAAMQTWWLAVHQDEVIWRRDNASMTFSATTWQST
ncbi:MAG: RES family NAD+ phosphorylase [Sulfuricellaceae bacterium]|nr:RES family NAD+ phosphorylase [Sulfuricellaceae bacterium]